MQHTVASISNNSIVFGAQGTYLWIFSDRVPHYLLRPHAIAQIVPLKDGPRAVGVSLVPASRVDSAQVLESGSVGQDLSGLDFGPQLGELSVAAQTTPSQFSRRLPANSIVYGLVVYWETENLRKAKKRRECLSRR